jgi:hypothetical protein
MYPTSSEIQGSKSGEFFMYIPFHYQVSEYDCVPTAMVNAISYLFPKKEIPPPWSFGTFTCTAWTR